MLPRIICTRREEMVKPNPVPPKLRVVVVSAWAKASKMTVCLSAGMPMPVSLTTKCRRFGRRYRIQCHRQGHFAAFGKFKCVAHQVHHNLP